MDILTAVRDVYCDHLREHGTTPRKVYLGRMERESLTQYTYHNPWHRSMVSDVSEERVPLCGMTIYYVDEPSHINCCP